MKDYFKEFAREFIAVSDRETSVTFVSMIVASYAWIMTEHLVIGFAVGIAMHAIQTIAYEILATRFGWQHMGLADAFYTHVLPRFRQLVSLFSPRQRA